MAEPKENPVIEKVLYIQRNFPGLIENILDELFQNFTGQRRVAPERPTEERKYDHVDSTGYAGYKSSRVPAEVANMPNGSPIILPRRSWSGITDPSMNAIEIETTGKGFPSEIVR